MTIELLSFGAQGHPITDKTLPLLEALAERDKIEIGSVRPVFTRDTDGVVYEREYGRICPHKLCGVIREVDYDFYPGEVKLWGKVEAEGPRSHLLKMAQILYGKDLKLIPRLRTVPVGSKFEIVEVIGFDLLMDHKGVKELSRQFAKIEC